MSINLNAEQALAVDMATAGKSFNLIGAAGSGKSTTLKAVARKLLQSTNIGRHTFRIQGTQQTYCGHSIAFAAYTKTAARNVQRILHKDSFLQKELPYNITTIHNLLEYTPVFYWHEVLQKECVKFVPRRNASNPLDVTHLIIDEASMVDLPLWQNLYNALRPGTQILFVGDINQLQPVFGASILGHSLRTLPTVELRTIYRQETDSTILKNAINILQGKALERAEDFSILQGKQGVEYTAEQFSSALLKKFQALQKTGEYDAAQDIILSPFNKGELGTTTLNMHIAHMLDSLQSQRPVIQQIKAGRNVYYLAVGDRVFVNRQAGIIRSIARNWEYRGKPCLPASRALTRYGIYLGTGNDFDDDALDIPIPEFLDEDDEKRMSYASHALEIELTDTGNIVYVETNTDYHPQNFSLGYCLTVHKAQGQAWRHVYILVHKEHATLLHRELLYTAVTRATDKVIIFGKDYLIARAIANPRIKGESLQAKIEYFNLKLTADINVAILKE